MWPAIDSTGTVAASAVVASVPRGAQRDMHTAEILPFEVCHRNSFLALIPQPQMWTVNLSPGIPRSGFERTEVADPSAHFDPTHTLVRL
jgi:hypothetical protein